jgi:hypothetical protein
MNFLHNLIAFFSFFIVFTALSKEKAVIFECVSEEFIVSLLSVVEEALETSECHRAIEVLIFIDKLILKYSHLETMHITCLLFISQYFICVTELSSALEVLQEAL